MHLFKRLLLTKFPNSTIHNMMNPASMFIGLISAKEFFSIINRKIIENYKLNLFDVNLDPVEFKMGFGEEQIQNDQKELDTYFAYCVAANLNGSLFYSPSNLGNAISLLASTYFKESTEEFPQYCFSQLIYTVYLLCFTFASRIKVFPAVNDQENYNWFIDVFFDFYKMTFQQLQTKISDKEFNAIKKSLLQETAFFFLLFHFYKKLNSILGDKTKNEEDYLDWLLGRTNNQDTILKAFKSNYLTTRYLPHSSSLEQKILNRVWPADILIKYIFGDSDPILAVDTIIEKIFNKTELDPIVESFLKSDKELPRLLQYLLEYKRYKYGFFSGVQNYMIRLFRKEGNDGAIEDLDEMLSAIDNGDDISNFDIPEKIKRESRVTERLLNYYITLLGGFTSARGDSFYIRLFKPEILEFFSKRINIENFLGKPPYAPYFDGVLYSYSNVLYYYVYIDSRVRSGQLKIKIPTKSEIMDNGHFNETMTTLYLEGMISAYFQDINPKDTKLTVKNSQIVGKFKALFGKQIQEIVKTDNNKFLVEFYSWGVGSLKSGKEFMALLQNVIQEGELINLKESLYKLDYRITKIFLGKIKNLSKKKGFDDIVTLSIYGIIRETVFGLALLYTYLLKFGDESNRDKAPMLLLLYVKDILMLDLIGFSEEAYDALYSTIMELQSILEPWCSLDDNKSFFDLFDKNWKKYISRKKVNTLYKDLAIDDVVWFRGLLKNITYYNKRFIIPG